MKRVLFVEDHKLLREGLAAELDRQPDLEVAAQASSLAAARSAVELGAIDIAIVDSNLPGGDGFELVRELGEAQPHSIPTLVVTTSLDPVVYDLALQAGASEVLAPGVSFEHILLALSSSTKAYLRCVIN